MTAKPTMTLNLSPAEMAYIDARAAECDMSKTAVVRQALRLYQLVVERNKAGETMHFSGDRERLALFVGPGFDVPTQPQTHDFAPHPKWPWFCKQCGYAPHEPLMHPPAAS